MATSNIEIVFGFKDNTTKKITFGPFASNSPALAALKAKIIAFNTNYTPNKWKYDVSGTLNQSELQETTYPLIVNKDGYELLDSNPIVDAYIVTTNRTEINLNG